MCALLVREPFNMRLADIARLTDYQIASVLFRPRDEDGCLERPATTRALQMASADEVSPPPLPDEVRRLAEEHGQEQYLPLWWAVWHRRGLTMAELAAKWREYLEQRRE